MLLRIYGVPEYVPRTAKESLSEDIVVLVSDIKGLHVERQAITVEFVTGQQYQGKLTIVAEGKFYTNMECRNSKRLQKAAEVIGDLLKHFITHSVNVPAKIDPEKGIHPCTWCDVCIELKGSIKAGNVGIPIAA